MKYEVIGDIAILDWLKSTKTVATELLETRRDIKVALAATSGVRGEYRLKDLVFVAGERRTETTHKEYGSALLLDVSKVYFSPRLATERHRVAGLAESNETAVDMFAGAGPFTIMLAKKVKQVIAFEINPVAVYYLKKNIELNNITNVIACLGNARDMAPEFRGAAQRVVMNLPHSAFEFLGEALMTLDAAGGFIHYYDVKPENEFAYTVDKVKEAIVQHGRTVDHLDFKKVRSYAPRRYHIVLDIKVAED
jgi:tRNA (guanine37-N1)-methyltransferase